MACAAITRRGPCCAQRGRPDNQQLSHLCLGGLLRDHGHALNVTAEEAVLTAEGDGLVLPVAHPELVWN